MPLAITTLFSASMRSIASPALNLLVTDFMPAGNKEAPLLTTALTAPWSRLILPRLFKVCFSQCFLAVIISLSATK